MLLIARPQVDLGVRKQIVGAKTYQEVLAKIIIRELPNFPLIGPRIAVITHEAIEQSPCIIHGDSAAATGPQQPEVCCCSPTTEKSPTGSSD